MLCPRGREGRALSREGGREVWAEGVPVCEECRWEEGTYYCGQLITISKHLDYIIVTTKDEWQFSHQCCGFGGQGGGRKELGGGRTFSAVSAVGDGDVHSAGSLRVCVALCSVQGGRGYAVAMKTIIEWRVFHHGMEVRQSHLVSREWLQRRETDVVRLWLCGDMI